MDESQMVYFYNKQIEADKTDKIMFKLNLAEAFNFAYIGGQYDKSGKCIEAYRGWRERKVNELLPDDKKIKPSSFWDKKDQMTKKSKRKSFKLI